MNPLIFPAFSIKCSMLQTDQLQCEPRATFLHVYWIKIHADHTDVKRDKTQPNTTAAKLTGIINEFPQMSQVSTVDHSRVTGIQFQFSKLCFASCELKVICYCRCRTFISSNRQSSVCVLTFLLAESPHFHQMALSTMWMSQQKYLHIHFCCP